MSQSHIDNDKYIDNILSHLKLAMHYQQKSTIDQFMIFDTDKSFFLNQQEFGQFLVSVAPTLTVYDVNYAFDRFDTDKSGTVSYLEFARALDGVKLPEGKRYLTKQQLKEQQEQNVSKENLEKLLQEHWNAKSQSIAQLTINKLKQAIIYYKIDVSKLFKDFDTSGDSNLDYNEFAQLAMKMEPNLTFLDILNAFAIFDNDKNNSINLKEFQEVLLN